MQPRSLPDERRSLAIDHRPTILIVDGDRVSERAIEIALAQCDYVVEWARDGEAALDIMRQAKTDMVIADSVLADMSGATLLRRTVDLCGPGAPAFVFVTVDRAVATRVGLLVAGAADLIIKPFVADELRARVVNAIEARRPARTAATRGLTGLAGDCAHVPLADLLTMLEFGHKSGVVEVSVGPATGRLVIDDGRVVRAELGTLSGEDAFFALLRATGGLFRFELGEVDEPHTLNARVSELLLESAVREDTAKHWIDQDARRRTEAGLRELGVVKTPAKLRIRRDAQPPPPSLVLAARRLAVAVADSFSLGDLVLGAAPAAATAELRIELWASLTDGVMALLGLASPPGYRLVIAAMQGDHERLHLRFEIATAALVVTLVDIDSHVEPPAIAPHGLVVAPPRGELIALAPQRLAELTGRLAGDAALAVVVLGGAALHATVERLCDDGTTDGSAPRAHALATTLDADPRDALGAVLRAWTAHHDHDA